MSKDLYLIWGVWFMAWGAAWCGDYSLISWGFLVGAIHVGIGAILLTIFVERLETP